MYELKNDEEVKEIINYFEKKIVKFISKRY